VHRPDGYWHVKTDNGYRTIALEIELSQKRNGDYDKARIFYDRQPAIKKVIWVVKTPGLMGQIHRRMNQFSKHGEKHNFVYLKDFLMNGWNAPIQLGPDSGKSILELLHHRLATATPPVVYRKFLDIRKSPHKSSNYRFPEFGHFRDCMAKSPNSFPIIFPQPIPNLFSNPITKGTPNAK